MAKQSVVSWPRVSDRSIKAARIPRSCVSFSASGTLNAFVIYFRLRCDDDNVYDSGPSNAQPIAWDQSVRFLPVEQRLYLRTPPPLTPNTANP